MNEIRARSRPVGVAQQHFNVGMMKAKLIPLIPAAEQEEMLKRIEAILARVDATTEDVEKARRAAAVIDRSILAKAFRGELVPQDPSDEPASVLLDRIRAEREAAATKKPKRKRRASTKA